MVDSDYYVNPIQNEKGMFQTKILYVPIRSGSGICYVTSFRHHEKFDSSHGTFYFACLIKVFT